MAGWKKVIVSGSNAELNTVTASFFSGDGSALTNVPAGSINIESFTDGTAITVASTDKLILSDNGTEKFINISQLPFTADTNTQNDAAAIRTKVGNGNNGLLPASAGTAGHFLKHDGSYGLPSYTTNTNTQLSAEQVEDMVDDLIVGGTNVTATYNDSAGTLTLSSTDTVRPIRVFDGSETVSVATSDTLTLSSGTGMRVQNEDGVVTFTNTSTNTVLSTAQVRAKISASGNSSYNSTTGVITSTDTNTQLDNAGVIGKVLTGLSTSTGGAVAAADTLVVGIGKLEKRVALNDAKVTNTNTQLSDAQVRGKFSAGTNVAITAAGVISSTDTNTDTNTTTTADVKSALGASLGSFTMGDSNDTITVAGNLTISGDTTTVSTTNMVVTDAVIGLNNGGGERDVAIVDTRSTSGLGYDASEARWGFDLTGASVGDNTISFDAYTAAVVTTDLAGYRKLGNIRVTSDEIFIYA